MSARPTGTIESERLRFTPAMRLAPWTLSIHERSALFRCLNSPVRAVEREFGVSDGTFENEFAGLTEPGSRAHDLAVFAAKREKRRFDI